MEGGEFVAGLGGGGGGGVAGVGEGDEEGFAAECGYDGLGLVAQGGCEGEVGEGKEHRSNCVEEEDGFGL